MPISATKYKDLIRLCENFTIPKYYHSEYRNLPSTANVPDILPEMDEEDEEDTEDDIELDGDGFMENNM